MIVSAHDLCRTRLCRAENCTRDAEPYQRVCWICARQDHAQRNAVTHQEELECARCHAWKPDNAFGTNRRLRHRRHRHYICTECLQQAGIASRDRANERQREMRRERADAFVAAGLTRRGTPRVYAPRSTA